MKTDNEKTLLKLRAVVNRYVKRENGMEKIGGNG
jgi:hypothetical protein